MHQNVARCRDGDVSRVSLKYDAAECSPGLLSMAWYPSLMVSGRRRMFTSVGEHGMVAIPPCSWSFSTSWFFHAGTRVLQRHMAPSLHHFLFKLHCGTCSLALKAREETVLTTILYMPLDVVYYLFLCVLLLLCQPGLLSMEW